MILQRTSISWPNRDIWRAFLKFMALFYVFFFPVYIGAGKIAAHMHDTYAMYWDWERFIPVIPWMIWPYLTLFPLFLLPLFHMNSEQISTLSRQSTATLIIAGAIFLLFPTHLGFAHDAIVGPYGPLFGVLSMMDTPHNLVPSLHVAFGALIFLGCAEQTSAILAWTYRVWLPILSASTVLVHQHHVFDVFSGLALALIIRRIFPIEAA